MFSHYDLIVAQDRADRIASAGYRINGSTGGEFKAEDITRALRAHGKRSGGWVQALCRRLGLVSDSAGRVRPAQLQSVRLADVIPASRSGIRPAQGVAPEQQKAA
jgi:hypothetical protein